jgi:molecular chaperone GrpE
VAQRARAEEQSLLVAFLAFSRVKRRNVSIIYIFSSAHAKKLSIFRGNICMTNEQETQTQQQKAAHARAEQLERALEEQKKLADEYLTRWKYTQADLENLRKRADREVEEARKYSNERIVLPLLDVLDELEMAVVSGRSCEPADVLVQGVQMTLRKLTKVLEAEGVFHIECVGKPFDPLKHHVIAKVEREDVPDCTVIEEIRKGYSMREKVIRPSIVKVSVKPESLTKKGNDLV